MKLYPLLLGIALFASSASAVPRVTRAGRYLYQEDGTRFYIKGIAYQEQGIGFLQSFPHFQKNCGNKLSVPFPS